MTRKKNDAAVKPLQKIETSITEIIIIGNDALKPYIQTFHYEPENVTLIALGSVLGIFEIEDQSEDSAYIVNFLTSIVKKEYFAHPKRAAIESLEATLHKINLALSELIKQDNTAWLGKINATLCVFEKNNIHFSAAGKAKVILFRNGLLNDISEGLAEDSELHPLKTFTEVSSGRLNEHDKIILTTPGLFDIFSPEELRKNATRFSNEKFAQLLKTALVNHLLFGGTLIVDVSAAIKKDPVLKKETSEEMQEDIPNVFSQSAFSDKKPAKETIEDTDSSGLIDIDESVSQEIEYTDSKTGHIYVQGNVPEEIGNEKWEHAQWKMERFVENSIVSVKKTWSRHRKVLIDTIEKRKSPQNTTKSAKESLQKTVLFLKKNFPRVSTIKNDFLQLGSRQKKYALGALLLIFTVPFLLTRNQASTQPIETPPAEKPIVIPEKPLSKDRGIKFVFGQSVFAAPDILSVILLKNTPFAVSKHSVTSLADIASKTQASILPESFGSILKATAMNDIDTIFLLTDTGKIIAFTPIDKTFKENTAPSVNVSGIADIGTYLTYLYVLDSESNAIFRYPRTEGGFGERTSWLKETIDIQKDDSLSIGENIFLTQSPAVITLNKGKRESISFEQSVTPVVFSKTFTKPDALAVFVLDAQNGRVLRYDKTGALTAQYADVKLKGALSIAVNEQQKKAYVATSSEVFSLSLEE